MVGGVEAPLLVATRPMNVVCQIFSVSPLGLHVKLFKEGVHSYYNTLGTRCFILTCITLAVSSYLTTMLSFLNGAIVTVATGLMVSYHMTYTLTYAAAVATLFNNFLGGTKRYLTIFRDLSVADNEEIIMSPSSKHFRYTRMLSIMTPTLVISINVAKFISGYIIDSDGVSIELIAFLSVDLITALSISQYWLLLSEIRRRLADMNRKLETITEAHKQPPFGVRGGKESNVSVLRRLHIVLHDTATLVDRHFGISLLFGTAQSFCGIIMCGNEILHYSILQSLGVSSLVDSCYWLLAEGFKIFLSCWSVTALVSEFQRTGTILSRVIMDHPTAVHLTEMVLFLQQTTVWRKPPSFSASGLFIVDMKLMFSVIGATATYIIIIAQLVLK